MAGCPSNRFWFNQNQASGICKGFLGNSNVCQDQYRLLGLEQLIRKSLSSFIAIYFLKDSLLIKLLYIIWSSQWVGCVSLCHVWYRMVFKGLYNPHFSTWEQDTWVPGLLPWTGRLSRSGLLSSCLWSGWPFLYWALFPWTETRCLRMTHGKWLEQCGSDPSPTKLPLLILLPGRAAQAVGVGLTFPPVSLPARGQHLLRNG